MIFISIKAELIYIRTRRAVAFIFALLNKAMAAEECDARDDAIRYVAGPKTKTSKFVNLYMALTDLTVIPYFCRPEFITA